jgi:hypothetical protein
VNVSRSCFISNSREIIFTAVGIYQRVSKKEKCGKIGPVFVAHVCGTDRKRPTEPGQVGAEALEAGAIVVDSNAAAARLAGMIVS